MRWTADDDIGAKFREFPQKILRKILRAPWRSDDANTRQPLGPLALPRGKLGRPLSNS